MQRTLKAGFKDMWPNGGSPFTVTTTASYQHLDTDAQEVTITGDDEFQLKFSPRIKTAWFYDAGTATYGDGATTGADAADELQDSDTTTALTLNSMTSSDKVYVRMDTPCVGFDVNVGNTNGNTAAMTVKYYNGTAFADVTATDGTDSGGATLATDGQITWSEPSDEVTTTINNIEGYWYEITVDATLDSSVTILEMQALSRRGNIIMEADVTYTFSLNREAIAGLEFDIASGTTTVQVIDAKY